MNEGLVRLVNALESNQWLHKSLFASQSISSALEDRNSTDFEQAWLSQYQAVGDTGIPDAEQSSILKRIRELAFKSIYSSTQNPEAAAYVSDDFDLIARAILFDYEHPWLNGLFRQYLLGRFPTGKVQQSELSINKF